MRRVLEKPSVLCGLGGMRAMDLSITYGSLSRAEWQNQMMYVFSTSRSQISDRSG